MSDDHHHHHHSRLFGAGDAVLPLSVSMEELDPEQQAGLFMLIECLERGTETLNAANHAKGQCNEGKASEEEQALVHFVTPQIRLFAAAAEGSMVTQMVNMLKHRNEGQALQETAFHVAAVMFNTGVEYGKHLSLGQTPQKEESETESEKEEPDGNKES